MAGTRWVAEIGSNHNGSILRAEEIIERCALAGFWGVKLQHFVVERLFHESALAAKPELRRRRDREVPAEWHKILSQIAHGYGMSYGLSIFDPTDVDLLPYVDFWKVSSYDLLRLDLIRELRWRPVIISTGMATMEECQAARAAALEKNPDVTMLHCVSSYPTPPSLANLRVMDMMGKMLGVPIGYSDHTGSPEVLKRAVWRWRACMVELHVDLDDGAGAESGAGHCWTVSGAERIVDTLKKTELPNYLPREHAIDGLGVKVPMPCEEDERLWRADPKDGLRPTEEMRAMLLAKPSERT